MDGLQEHINNCARWYLEKLKMSIIPIGDGKSPLIEWKPYIDKLLPKWSYPGCNIALLTGQFNNLVVADCDSEEAYIGWLRTKTPTPLRVRTKRGMQFYYRHPGAYVKSDAHIKDPSGFEYDVKGDRSYVLAPPSLRGGHQYQVCVCTGNPGGKLLPFDSLPVFEPAWRPERPVVGNSSTATGIRNGATYISHIRACAGAGGDKETYRAACKLAESGMSESEALATLIEWNKTNADPAWSNRQLLYKVQKAFSQAK